MSNIHTIFDIGGIQCYPSTFFDVKFFDNNGIEKEIDNGRVVFAKENSKIGVGLSRPIKKDDDLSDYAVVCEPSVFIVDDIQTYQNGYYYNSAGDTIRVARLQYGDKYYLSKEGFIFDPSQFKDGTLVCIDIKSGKFDLWSKEKESPCIGRLRSKKHMCNTELYSVAIIMNNI